MCYVEHMTKEIQKNVLQSCIANISGRAVGDIVTKLQQGQNDEAYKMAKEHAVDSCQCYKRYCVTRPSHPTTPDLEIYNLIDNVYPAQVAIVVLNEALARAYPFSVKR